MNIYKSILFLALASAPLAVLAAEAEDTPPAPEVFVKNAALDGMAEVELGKIALSKSQNPEVRRFAQRMVTDHGKANQELATIAKSKGLETPASLDAEHRTMIANIEREDGAAFDKAYCEHMNMDHTKAIALFTSAEKSSDADLALFAKKTLPTLEEHKKMAEKLPD
jgi:putative membrane protein